MAMIRRFRVDGLAGRREVCSAELNDHVNVCFGFNGSGKTSLLRIFHSALSNNGEMLRNVPFARAEVVLYSYLRKTEFTYVLDRSKPAKDSDPDRKSVPPSRNSLTRLFSKKKLVWEIDPPDGGAWHHRFLPTTRLYTLPSPQSAIYGFARQSDETEEQLEASFVSSLIDTWKDYSAELAQETKEVQEAGLARILKNVISPTESHPSDDESDPQDAYKAVTQFLARRGMSDDSPSEKEFQERYRSDLHLRNVSKDIEEIERRIARLMAPREMFKSVVNEMLMPGKSMTFDEKGIEIAVGDKNIELATLSSGEKHLLRILVETIAVKSSPMLVDEPELSMHVDWQRRLISTMRTLNRSAQMIFATHSPEIMAELPDSEIFRI